jgi:capsular polysaccharide biosynthesis protein
MRTTSYRQALRARRFVIAATGLLVICLAVLAPPAPVSYSDPSTALEDVASPAHARYQATSSIGIPPIRTGGDATTQFKTIQFYVQSAGVSDAFSDRLGYSGHDFEMLGRLIEIDADEKSGIMTVKGFGGTPQQAADITNAFTQSLRDYLSGLATQATEQSLQQAGESVQTLRQRIDDLSARIATLRGDVDPTQAALDPRVAQLQAEHDALIQSYTAAYQNLTNIRAGGAGVSTAGLTVLQSADAAGAEEQPPSLLYSLWLRIVLGLVLGLALGAALALLLEHNARKVFTRETAEQAFGARILAEIPRRRLTGTARDVVVVTAPGSRAASAYRMLRVVLLAEQTTAAATGKGTLTATPRPALARTGARETPDQASTTPTTIPRQGHAAGADAVSASGAEPGGNGASSTAPDESIEVSSAGARGRTAPGDLALVVAAPANEPAHAAVVANLAASFAESGRAVTVLRTSRSARRVDGAADDGAADDGAADDDAPGGALARDSAIAGVRVVDWEPGQGGASPPELVHDLRENGGVVLVDAGRVATAEFAEVAPLVDGVVAVCQIGRTTIENAERTADIVAWSHARLIGVVLAQTPATSVERMMWGRRRRSPLTTPPRGRPESDDERDPSWLFSGERTGS